MHPWGIGAALFLGVLCSQGCLVLPAPASSSCLQHVVWCWQQQSLGTRLRIVWHKGSFSPPFPSPAFPPAASQSRGAVAGSLLGPVASRDSQSSGNGAFTAPEWALPAISQVAKNQTRKGTFGPARGQTLRDPARLGAALGRRNEAPLDLLRPRQTRGRGLSTPHSAAFVPCLLLAWGSHWGGSARTIPHCPWCHCATSLPVGRAELARTPRLSCPLGEEISTVGFVEGAWVWCGCLSAIQGRNAMPRWDVPLCPGHWGARAHDGQQLPQVSHRQGSSLSQLSWSQMLVGANPAGCLPPKQAGQQLAGHLQTQPTGKRSQHSCTLEPQRAEGAGAHGLTAEKIQHLGTPNSTLLCVLAFPALTLVLED